jgi:hypothetical protein
MPASKKKPGKKAFVPEVAVASVPSQAGASEIVAAGRVPDSGSLEGDIASGGVSVRVVDGHAGSDQTSKNPETGDHVDAGVEGGNLSPADHLKAARDLIAGNPLAGSVESEVAGHLIAAGKALGLQGYAELSDLRGHEMKRVRGLWDGTQRIFKDILGNTCLTITKSLMEVDLAIQAKAKDAASGKKAARETPGE